MKGNMGTLYLDGYPIGKIVDSSLQFEKYEKAPGKTTVPEFSLGNLNRTFEFSFEITPEKVHKFLRAINRDTTGRARYLRRYHRRAHRQK
jgi:hypothetical protein